MATISADDSCPTLCHFQRAIPLRDSKTVIGPFRATQIWNEIICHLKCRVEIKRRRHMMRSYNNCFTGADAVDVVLHYLLNDRDNFGSDLSREKAIKLCQALMDRAIFRPVGSRHSEVKKQKPTFDDSTNKLYIFLDDNCDSVSQQDSHSDESEEHTDDEQSDEVFEAPYCEDDDIEMEDRRKYVDTRMDTSTGSDLMSDGVICSPNVVSKKGQILQELLALKRSLQRGSGIFKYDKSTRKSLDISSIHKDTGISPEEIENVWREVALCQLLTLVDIPFLDGLLGEDKQKRKSQIKNFIFSKESNKQKSPLKDSANCEDLFLSTATECIEFLPKGQSMVDKDLSAKTSSEQKHHLFKVISDYYKSVSEPILPSRFAELHLAILNLVFQQKDELACKAFQLDMVLLAWPVRDELQRLLKFMAAAATDDSVNLRKNETNETVVLNTFTNVILKHNKVLPFDLSSILAGFMMCNAENLFAVPKELRESVDLKIKLMKIGDPSVTVQGSRSGFIISDTTFCNRVSADEYKRQTIEGTHTALADMMNTILDDTSLSLKDKQQRLNQFQKYHPHVYAKHFAGMV